MNNNIETENMSKNYSVVEQPLGIFATESRLERLWKNYPGRYSLSSDRIIKYDPYSNMSWAPVKYSLTHFSIDNSFPEEEWIKKTLGEFIRDEFSYQKETTPSSFNIKPAKTIYVDETFLSEIIAESEWEKLLTVELPKDNSDDAMAESIYNLLCNNKIGSSKNRTNVDIEEFKNKVIPLIQKQKRLYFVLPGFPFKDQNRFRVHYGASTVDFSEVSFLMRLHNVVQALYQVHPYGANVIILSDGRLYQEIFGVDAQNVDEYQRRLKYYRNRLNIAGDVSIIDLKELINRADENKEITRIIKHIEKVLRDKYTQTEEFSVLIQGMKWNMNSRRFLNELTDKDAWSVIKDKKSDIPKDLLSEWEKYNSLAIEAAIKYASINLMLRWTNLIYKFFPEALRCTVHPKKNQIALAMNYPWNGVAWSEKWPKGLHNIRSEAMYKLSGRSKIKKVLLRGTNYPCFYTTGLYKQNLDAAKHVLNPNGWNYGPFLGREFNIYDLDSFAELGKDDPNFNWERKNQSKDYYTSLLQFRIAHYKKYGFGVHAIFMEGKLIGQMGLQVLQEKNDRLEFVIFLGKEYVNKGYGTKLINYLIEQCRKAGITQIYSVIRSDNKIAEKAISKFNPTQKKTMPHYHETGILYELKI